MQESDRDRLQFFCVGPLLLAPLRLPAELGRWPVELEGDFCLC